MSSDLKIIETEFSNLKEKPKYNFIKYLQIELGEFDCWYYIKNNINRGYFVEENPSDDDLMTWNSYMFDKDVLKDLLNKYDKDCPLKEELLNIINKMQYQYIVLQYF